MPFFLQPSFVCENHSVWKNPLRWITQGVKTEIQVNFHFPIVKVTVWRFSLCQRNQMDSTSESSSCQHHHRFICVDGWAVNQRYKYIPVGEGSWDRTGLVLWFWFSLQKLPISGVEDLTVNNGTFCFRTAARGFSGLGFTPSTNQSCLRVVLKAKQSRGGSRGQRGWLTFVWNR